MAYIPEAHKKYNLLPKCAERGGEVFSYPSSEREISKMLPEGEHVVPYGYDSYADFDNQLDQYIQQYGTTNGALNELGQKIVKYKETVHKMNVKENWSVLRYLGETTPNLFGLTQGRYYYWPCFIEDPHYEGVIDDEEFTSYLAYAIEDPKISDGNIALKGDNVDPTTIPFLDPKITDDTDPTTVPYLGLKVRCHYDELDQVNIDPATTPSLDPKISDENLALEDGTRLASYADSHLWEIAEDPTGMAAKVLADQNAPVNQCHLVKPRIIMCRLSKMMPNLKLLTISHLWSCMQHSL